MAVEVKMRTEVLSVRVSTWKGVSASRKLSSKGISGVAAFGRASRSAVPSRARRAPPIDFRLGRFGDKVTVGAIYRHGSSAVWPDAAGGEIRRSWRVQSAWPLHHL